MRTPTLGAMNDTDLQVPQLYLNRELSFLEFNQRVLEQAKDPRIPLLERVRFLCISCANLDEFFEIRVASLKELLEAGAVQPGADALSVPDTLKAIRARAATLVDEQYALLNDVLMPELAKNGVIFVEPETWTEAQSAWLADYFTREVAPVLSPLALDPARPFPKILNKSLNFAIVVEGEDGFGRNSGLAVVQAPRSLPRLIRLPDELGSRHFVFSRHDRRGICFASCSPACACAGATSSGSPATATCSSSRRRWTTCCGRSKASSRRAATATRCASRPRTIAPTRY